MLHNVDINLLHTIYTINKILPGSNYCMKVSLRDIEYILESYHFE